MQQLRDQPTTLDLREDVIRVSALLDLVMSGQLDIDPGDLVSRPEMMAKLVDIIRQFTPEDRLPDAARALRMLTPNAAPAGDSAE